MLAPGAVGTPYGFPIVAAGATGMSTCPWFGAQETRRTAGASDTSERSVAFIALEYLRTLETRNNSLREVRRGLFVKKGRGSFDTSYGALEGNYCRNRAGFGGIFTGFFVGTYCLDAVSSGDT